MPYKDKDKQKEVQRNWVRQKRVQEKGSTFIIDACGKEHPIDFEGRHKDVALLEPWSKGTARQRILADLAMMHSRINGFRDNNLTPQGHRYLGTAC